MATRHELAVSSLKLGEGRNEVNSVIYGPDGNVYVSYGHHIITVSPRFEISRFAGSETESGTRDGHRLEALFKDTYGLCFASFGPLLVVENVGQRIKAIEADMVTSYAGTGASGHRDGPRLEAQFRNPSEIVELNEHLFVTDFTNCRVRMISPEGQVTSIGSGEASSKVGDFASCSFYKPWGLCVGPNNTILVAEYHGHQIKKIDLEEGQVTVLAGSTSGYADGDALTAQFNGPIGMCTGPSNEVYIVDRYNNRLRMIDEKGITSTVIGTGNSKSKDGPLLKACTKNHQGICLTPDGDLFWTEYSTHSLRFVQGFIPDMAERLRRHERFVSFIMLRHKHKETSPTTHFASSASNANSMITALEVSNLISPDFRLIHTASNTIFYLHSSVLDITCPRLNKPRYRSKVCNSLVTPEVLDMLFDLLYGHKPHFPPLKNERSARQEEVFQFYWDYSLIQAQLLHLLQTVKMKASILDWAVQTFNASLSKLSVPRLIQLLIEVVKKSANNDTFLRLIIGQLRRDQKEFLQHKTLLEPLASDLNEVTLYGSLLVDIVSEEGPEQVKIQSSFVEAYASALKSMAKLSAFLSWRPTQTEVPEIQAPFCWRLMIEGDTSESIHVHDWVLYPRWNFFRKLVDAGMSEVKSKTIEFPSHWTKDALFTLVRYIYTSVAETETLSSEVARFLLLNGEEFYILDQDGNSMPGFDNLITACQQNVIRPLTVENCIKELKLRQELGLNSAINKAMTYVTRNLDAISSSSEAYKDLKSLPDPLIRELFFARFNGSQRSNSR